MQPVPVMNISIIGQTQFLTSQKLVKCIDRLIALLTTLLTNQIIHTVELPKQLKIAKVKPLFKKGKQSSFTNYMTISLLFSISKIFEHV